MQTHLFSASLRSFITASTRRRVCLPNAFGPFSNTAPALLQVTASRSHAPRLQQGPAVSSDAAHPRQASDLLYYLQYLTRLVQLPPEAHQFRLLSDSSRSGHIAAADLDALCATKEPPASANLQQAAKSQDGGRGELLSVDTHFRLSSSQHVCSETFTDSIGYCGFRWRKHVWYGQSAVANKHPKRAASLLRQVWGRSRPVLLTA